MDDEYLNIVNWHSDRFLEISTKVQLVNNEFDSLNMQLYNKIINSKNLSNQEIIELCELLDYKRINANDECMYEASDEFLKDFDSFLVEQIRLNETQSNKVCK